VLRERIGFKRLHWQNIFYPTTHNIFPGGSVTPGSRRTNVWSIDGECKTKNWYIALQVYFKHLKNRKNFSRISLFLANFTLKFLTCFLAGSSSFSWHDLASLVDNHLATLVDTSCIFRDAGAAAGKQSRRHGGLLAA